MKRAKKLTADSNQISEAAKSMRVACDGYLRAMVALRDAKRLLEIGFDAGTEGYRKVMRIDMDEAPLDVVIEHVVAKEARDRIELYERDPDQWAAGRTAAEAVASARKQIEEFARRDKCWVCEQSPALPCLRRHAQGRSCA